MKKEDRKFFSLFDILIVLVVIIASVFSFLFVFSDTSENLCCVIKCNSEVLYTVDMSTITKEQIKTIDAQYPLTVVISSDCVYVKDACCPDRLCEHTGAINSANESIVCLPSKVTITLIGNDSDVDAVVG